MPHTLLLADDSVTIQRVIELTFAEEDVDVVAVSDGDQAIKRLETAPPDIVLADIGMPGRDGYEVARYIRQTPKLSHIPIVLLTGAFEPVDQAKAAEVGCDGVLAKPFEPQLVIGRVKELLSAGPRPAGTASFVPEVTPPEPDVEAPENLDEYFDRLDTAFSKLRGNTAAGGTAPERSKVPIVPEPSSTDADVKSVAEQIDSFAARHDEQPSADPDLPISYASPAPPTDPVSPAVAMPVAAAMMSPPSSPPEPVAPQSTAPPSASTFPPRSGPRELPTVAEAFAAILAAEQSESSPARPVWPATASPSTAPHISGDLIDQIVERVLSRLSIGDRVAEVTERLIREEIERIKSSIR